jgi:CelD/BcsL family acetyltransferase involved in cellulose biosynthesis
VTVTVLREREPGSTHEAWRALWTAIPSAIGFSHPDWIAPWWDSLGRDSQPFLTMVQNGSELRGVAPLALRATAFGAVLRPAGEGVSDYTDWLVPETPGLRNDVLGRLVDSIVSERDWIGVELPGWRDEASARTIANRMEHHGLTTRVLPGLVCPLVSMPNGFDAYYRSRGSQARYNIRSRERRLRQHGTVRYEHPSADEAPRLVEEAIALHARRWHGQRTSTVFSSSALGRAFYRASIPAAIRNSYGDFAVLTLNDRVIASAVGLRHSNEYGYYLPAWHPGYPTYAPSTLLLVHLMEYASEKGATRFDFMLGDEPYKAAWATGQERVHTVVAARPGRTGRLWLIQTLGYHALKNRIRESTRLMAIRRHGLSALLDGTSPER